jgi:hypothetical protein
VTTDTRPVRTFVVHSAGRVIRVKATSMTAAKAEAGRAGLVADYIHDAARSCPPEAVTR